MIKYIKIIGQEITGEYRKCVFNDTLVFYAISTKRNKHNNTIIQYENSNIFINSATFKCTIHKFYDNQCEISSVHTKNNKDDILENAHNEIYFSNYKQINYCISIKETKYKLDSLKFIPVYQNKINIQEISYIKKGDLRNIDLRYRYLYMLADGIIKFCLRRIYILIFILLPFHSIGYIKNQPMGIKQNVIIKEFLGTFLYFLLNLQRKLYGRWYLISIFTRQDKVFVKISLWFIFKLYRILFKSILDILELFHNKTYNTLKKRYDNVKLSIDQIILSVLFFSLFTLTMVNLVCYYIFYCFLYVLYMAIDTFELYIYILFVDTSNFYAYDEKNNKIKKVSTWDMIIHLNEFLGSCISLSFITNILRGKIAEIEL